ncbi:hypothetical protein LZ32DRAFT_643725 [Colletotrichum eremochloae]|nr:hypothetical protein LZ32DRAFT_643725 [Colletotrichum eremochloae]
MGWAHEIGGIARVKPEPIAKIKNGLFRPTNGRPSVFRSNRALSTVDEEYCRGRSTPSSTNWGSPMAMGALGSSVIYPDDGPGLEQKIWNQKHGSGSIEVSNNDAEGEHDPLSDQCRFYLDSQPASVRCIVPLSQEVLIR